MSKLTQSQIIQSLNNVYLQLCNLDSSSDQYREYRIWLLDIIDSLKLKFEES